jgi:hypothetical protein
VSTGWEERGNGTAQALVPQRCPACGLQLDGLGTTTTADVGPVQPEPGAVSVCVACTSILQFDDQLKIELLPAARWWMEFEDADRAHLEKVSVGCAATAPLRQGETFIAWHGNAWYAVSVWPNRDNPHANLVVRSRAYDTREPLQKLSKKGPTLSLVIGQVGLDPLVGRWCYTVHMESPTFGWRHGLERSESRYATKEEAHTASGAAVARIKAQYALGGQVLAVAGQRQGPLS